MGGFKTGPSVDNPPTLIFKIPFIKNPRSVITTSEFNVTIYSEDKQILYSLPYNESGPTVSMNGTGSPASIVLERSSQENG